MLPIGFVGTGLMGWAHALGLQAMIKAGHIDAVVAAVHDSDPERSAGFGAVNGAPAVPSIGEVVERCEAVWVCTPTAAHQTVVEQAAAAGRAVFCEKPLAPDLRRAEAMAATVAAAGIPAQVGLVLRFSPAMQALRAIVASGELGEPMTVVLRDDQYFPVQGIYASTWRGDVAVAGGGCLIEHSIHDVDILRYCLGEVTALSAVTAAFSGRPGVEDLAVVSMRFASGAQGQIVSVWHDILSRGSTRRIELFCRRGLVWLEDEFLGPLHVETSEGAEVRPCRWPGWVDALEVGDGEIGLAIRSSAEADRAFVDALVAGAPPAPSFEDAVVAHRIVDAAYRSAAARGRPIDLS